MQPKKKREREKSNILPQCTNWKNDGYNNFSQLEVQAPTTGNE